MLLPSLQIHCPRQNPVHKYLRAMLSSRSSAKAPTLFKWSETNATRTNRMMTMVRDQWRARGGKHCSSRGHYEPQCCGIITIHIIIALTIVVCLVVIIIVVVVVPYPCNPNHPTPDRPHADPRPPTPASCDPTPPSSLTTPRPVPPNPLPPPQEKGLRSPSSPPNPRPNGQPPIR